MMCKCKQILILLFLPIAISLSTYIYADELPQDYFNGMQLAWVRIPAASQEDSAATKKPETTQAPAATKKPATTPDTKPTPTAIPITTPVAKPVPAPIPPTAPIVKPVPPVKPAPVVKTAPATKPIQARSSSKIKPFQWLIGAGIDSGGEKLGTVTYSDGSSAAVKANSGVVLNFGAIIANGADSSFSTQISAGYKSGGPKIWSRDVNWSAIPLEIIEHYHTDYIRIGLGISYQLNSKLKVSLPTSNFTTKYKNAIGYIAQISWAPVRDNYSIDLRYTSIKFQPADTPSAPLINGNVVGLCMNYYF